MKEIENYKGVSIKYNTDNGRLLFDFEGESREVKYLFEAKQIIDEPRWEDCQLEGYFVDGYIDRFIGKAKATRKDTKSGLPDWKIKGQYDLNYKPTSFTDRMKIYARSKNLDAIYHRWEDQKIKYDLELRKLNDIAKSIKELS